MKQNINFTLLGLLVAVLIAMIAMNFYYSSNITKLSEEYKGSLIEKNNLSNELAGAERRVVEKESELNEKIKILNLSSSEISKFEDINNNLSDAIDAVDFENIYKTLSELKSETDLIGNATVRAKLNDKLNTLDQEVVELENQVLTIKGIVET
jgi:hypothetical protein